jgi:hypothetical protein
LKELVTQTRSQPRYYFGTHEKRANVSSRGFAQAHAWNQTDKIVAHSHCVGWHQSSDKILQILQRRIILIATEASGIIDENHKGNLAELRNGLKFLLDGTIRSTTGSESGRIVAVEQKSVLDCNIGSN